MNMVSSICLAQTIFIQSVKAFSLSDIQPTVNQRSYTLDAVIELETVNRQTGVRGRIDLNRIWFHRSIVSGML